MEKQYFVYGIVLILLLAGLTGLNYFQVHDVFDQKVGRDVGSLTGKITDKSGENTPPNPNSPNFTINWSGKRPSAKKKEVTVQEKQVAAAEEYYRIGCRAEDKENSVGSCGHGNYNETWCCGEDSCYDLCTCLDENWCWLDDDRTEIAMFKYNGIYHSCYDGMPCCPDWDEDGYDMCDSSAPGDNDGHDELDCRDFNEDINPGENEDCDGVDNDCDGLIYNQSGRTNEDCDSYEGYGGTCVNIDEDFDKDGDRYTTCGSYKAYPGGGAYTGYGNYGDPNKSWEDCDDGDKEKYPVAYDVCDNKDNNCGVGRCWDFDEEFGKYCNVPDGLDGFFYPNTENCGNCETKDENTYDWDQDDYTCDDCKNNPVKTYKACNLTEVLRGVYEDYELGETRYYYSFQDFLRDADDVFNVQRFYEVKDWNNAARERVIDAMEDVDCSKDKFLGCAKCINPGADEECDGIDNDCDGTCKGGENDGEVCEGSGDCKDGHCEDVDEDFPDEDKDEWKKSSRVDINAKCGDCDEDTSGECSYDKIKCCKKEHTSYYGNVRYSYNWFYTEEESCDGDIVEDSKCEQRYYGKSKREYMCQNYKENFSHCGQCIYPGAEEVCDEVDNNCGVGACMDEGEKFAKYCYKDGTFPEDLKSLYNYASKNKSFVDSCNDCEFEDEGFDWDRDGETTCQGDCLDNPIKTYKECDLNDTLKEVCDSENYRGDYKCDTDTKLDSFARTAAIIYSRIDKVFFVWQRQVKKKVSREMENVDCGKDEFMGCAKCIGERECDVSTVYISPGCSDKEFLKNLAVDENESKRITLLIRKRGLYPACGNNICDWRRPGDQFCSNGDMVTCNFKSEDDNCLSVVNKEAKKECVGVVQKKRKHREPGILFLEDAHGKIDHIHVIKEDDEMKSWVKAVVDDQGWGMDVYQIELNILINLGLLPEPTDQYDCADYAIYDCDAKFGRGIIH